jgi:regulator of cell morphogenesis and NO signaling
MSRASRRARESHARETDENVDPERIRCVPGISRMTDVIGAACHRRYAAVMKNLSSTSLAEHTLAEIVSADSRAAAIFDECGLDYCCRGQDTLGRATATRGVALDAVIDRLDALDTTGAASEEDWSDLTSLTRHIVERHHQYVRETTPTIMRWLDKLVDRHGARHPELDTARTTFGEISAELMDHMQKEELMLFPVIDAIADAARNKRPLPPIPFGSLDHPIRVMMRDHRATGDALSTLRQLTNDYTPGSDACTTYRLCYAELAHYESDLHRHVHLENHVLFPRAVELERSLA